MRVLGKQLLASSSLSVKKWPPKRIGKLLAASVIRRLVCNRTAEQRPQRRRVEPANGTKVARGPLSRRFFQGK